MFSMINMGIIGAGRIGRLHARHLCTRIPAARVLAVADIALDAAEECASELGIPGAFADPREVLEHPEIEAVVICSSTDTHATLIREAAAASKHIFCEKPIDIDLDRIDQALDAVREARVKLQVGFNRRFDPSFARARELVAVGRIGEPHLLRITSRDPEPPPIEYIRVSGGIFLDMTIHDFDMARFLIGSEVREVYAAGRVRVDERIREAGDIDTAMSTLSFENGVFGTIDNSRSTSYGYDQRVEVFGSEGMVSVANRTPDTAVLSDEGGVHGRLPHFFFVERYAESYVAEMEAFIECLQKDQAPAVTGADGRAAILIGYAARRSYEQNRPVELSEIAGS